MTYIQRIPLVIILCALILILPNIALPAYAEKTTDTDCYGFLVPLPSGTDSTSETFLNSRVRQMINDLLRENISVFWAANNFSARSKRMLNDTTTNDIFYEKGTFIIPFTPKENTTALITAIVNDYNRTNEIDLENSLYVPVYILMAPLTISAYELVEPKIAQHLGTPTRYGWPCYLQVAEAGGFLTMEFLLDNETSTNLNNADFNVFMWPYNPTLGTMLEQAQSLTNTEGCNTIRQFVRNGGSYIGSCYGAVAASSGVLRPIPIISLRRAYNTNLSCIPPSMSASISDTVMNQNDATRRTLCIATSEILDRNHPLTYGINKTVKEFYKGPWFFWLGHNTKPIASITALTTTSANNQINSLLEKKIVNTPSWVVSQFGKGQVVLFSSHPEFVNNISLLFEGTTWEGDTYYGRRVVHNALFFATSKALKNFTTTVEYPVAFIENLKEKTVDVILYESGDDEFNSIQTRIERFDNNLTRFQNTALEIINLSSAVIDRSILWMWQRLSRYTYYFCDIYHEYNQKTLVSLEKLEQVLTLIRDGNDSVDDSIQMFTSGLSSRLNHSNQLLSQVRHIAQNLTDNLRNNSLFPHQKLMIIEESREMLRTFEIGLKYIPQIYFETLKLLRHLWYTYESCKALE